MTADELASTGKRDPTTLAKPIQNFADGINNRGSTRYANLVIHIAQTFFKVNKVALELQGFFLAAGNRKRKEYVPTLEEALTMADVAGSLRDRLIILLLTYTGLRNSTLRAIVYNETYPDPFLNEYTVKKELERQVECAMIIVHEVMKQRIPNACKNRKFYYVFAPPEVTECLRLYVLEQEQKFGCIQDDYMIFATRDRKLSLRQRLRTPVSMRELEQIVKELARKAGIRNWKDVYPHCLRKTFEGFLRNQHDDVRLDNKEREFYFGHALPGTQDTYFDKMKIEEMRAKYVKMAFEPALAMQQEERVVTESNLESFLKDGWHFVAALPSGGAVISRKVRMTKTKTVSAESRAKVPKPHIYEEKTQTYIALPTKKPSVANDNKAESRRNEELDKASVDKMQNSCQEKLEEASIQDKFPRTPTEKERHLETKGTKPKPFGFGQTNLNDFAERGSCDYSVG
jgi:integrase